MKVTGKMINKELRFKGIAIKLVYKFRKEKQFIIINKIMDKTMKKKFGKDIKVEEKYIQNTDGTNLRILICYPDNLKSNATGVLWLHGGGYAIGLPEQVLVYAKPIVKNTNSIVIIPDYTRSVDMPYPAALNDCYNTLVWMKENSVLLGINKNQLFVCGESAGGGLAVATTLYARDKGEVNIAFQMPLYPMIDDRMNTNSIIDNNAPIWDYKANELGWKLYLGEIYKKNNVSSYAAPAREVNYFNLPPAYTFVGTIEPFYDETIDYINNLKNAGVIAKVDTYDGAFHGFDLIAKNTKIAKKATAKWLKEYQYAVDNYFTNNK